MRRYNAPLRRMVPLKQCELASRPMARLEEILEILWEESPSAWQVSGDQVAGGDPVLDRSNADLENAGNVAVRVHRLEGHVLDGQNAVQQWVLRLRCVVQRVLLSGPRIRHTSGVGARRALIGAGQFCKWVFRVSSVSEPSGYGALIGSIWNDDRIPVA